MLVVATIWLSACKNPVAIPEAQSPTHAPASAVLPVKTHAPTPRPTSTSTQIPACPPAGSEPPAPHFQHNPQKSISENFSPQIQAYLNAAGTSEGLQAALDSFVPHSEDGRGFFAEVTPAQLTGAPHEEILVDLLFFESGQYYEEAILVFSCRDGLYESWLLAEIFGQLTAEPGPAVLFIGDMNLNSIPEILYTDTLIVGTHGIFTRGFHIVEWDETEFKEKINNPDFPGTAFAINSGDGVVEDTNGDGRLELIITHGAIELPGSGPAREKTDIWSWDGSGYSLSDSSLSAPVYRFQVVQDGDTALQNGQYEKALTLYQTAIEETSLVGWSQEQLWMDKDDEEIPPADADEYARLSAYSRYRILLLYTMLGTSEEAQMVFNQLQETSLPGSPGYPYAVMAGLFWETYQQKEDLTAACLQVTQYADVHTEEVLSPLNSTTYGFNQPDLYTQNLCITE